MSRSNDPSDAAPEARPSVSGRFTVLERSPFMTFLSRALMILGPLLFIGAMTRIFPPGFLGIHLFVVGLLLTTSQRRHNLTAIRKDHAVTIAHEGVFIDGKLEVSRDKIANGFFQPRAPRDPSKKRSHGSSLKLVDKGKKLLFEVEAEEHVALQMLRALHLDPTAKRADFRGSSPMHSSMARNLAFIWGSIGATAALAAALTSLGVHVMPMLFPLVILPIVLAGSWPSRIEVGVDGILVSWLWQRRFIPMARVASMTPLNEHQVSIQLTDGTSETISTSTSRSRRGAYAKQHRDAVLARMLEAWAAFKNRSPVADVSALVARGSRTRSAWLDALRKLRGADGGYRAAVVRDEDLWRLIEDPTAPEDARAGAALVLREGLDDEGKSRVRVVAESTASPKLRVALDAAASGAPDEALAKALNELAEEAAEDDERRAMIASSTR